MVTYHIAIYPEQIRINICVSCVKENVLHSCMRVYIYRKGGWLMISGQRVISEGYIELINQRIFKKPGLFFCLYIYILSQRKTFSNDVCIFSGQTRSAVCLYIQLIVHTDTVLERVIHTERFFPFFHYEIKALML